MLSQIGGAGGDFDMSGIDRRCGFVSGNGTAEVLGRIDW